MKASSWDRVKQLFQEALDRRPEERSAYLRDVCGVDRTLLTEVESLLATHEQAGGFAEQPEVKLLGALGADSWITTLRRGLHARDRRGAYDIQALLGSGRMGD